MTISMKVLIIAVAVLQTTYATSDSDKEQEDIIKTLHRRFPKARSWSVVEKAGNAEDHAMILRLAELAGIAMNKQSSNCRVTMLGIDPKNQFECEYSLTNSQHASTWNLHFSGTKEAAQAVRMPEHITFSSNNLFPNENGYTIISNYTRIDNAPCVFELRAGKSDDDIFQLFTEKMKSVPKMLHHKHGSFVFPLTKKGGKAPFTIEYKGVSTCEIKPLRWNVFSEKEKIRFLVFEVTESEVTGPGNFSFKIYKELQRDLKVKGDLKLKALINTNKKAEWENSELTKGQWNWDEKWLDKSDNGQHFIKLLGCLGARPLDEFSAELLKETKM